MLRLFAIIKYQQHPLPLPPQQHIINMNNIIIQQQSSPNPNPHPHPLFSGIKIPPFLKVKKISNQLHPQPQSLLFPQQQKRSKNKIMNHKISLLLQQFPIIVPPKKNFVFVLLYGIQYSDFKKVLINLKKYLYKNK